ncbi:hypothetical protein BD309DRAFT_995358 [Dichomitus squalens]|uniref:Uncharacterized protein n=1 Tax=Dichomitus squalens TaxID=114155 RepID=A0A4Q9MKW4_9APHY|nr:hypothetical protein BD311DRAFT_778850 [Dichomitus squalens]TBU36937.1 hypothetical protein BD309DRAFT_995358 [Dichomitus squalens]TBU54597.1 hypothetical protein BD310DRAFT_961367 [Dichomitus squalens]
MALILCETSLVVSSALTVANVFRFLTHLAATLHRIAFPQQRLHSRTQVDSSGVSSDPPPVQVNTPDATVCQSTKLTWEGGSDVTGTSATWVANVSAGSKLVFEVEFTNEEHVTRTAFSAIFTVLPGDESCIENTSLSSSHAETATPTPTQMSPAESFKTIDITTRVKISGTSQPTVTVLIPLSSPTLSPHSSSENPTESLDPSSISSTLTGPSGSFMSSSISSVQSNASQPSTSRTSSTTISPSATHTGLEHQGTARSLTAGAIAGITTGILVVAAIICLVLARLLVRRRLKLPSMRPLQARSYEEISEVGSSPRTVLFISRPDSNGSRSHEDSVLGNTRTPTREGPPSASPLAPRVRPQSAYPTRLKMAEGRSRAPRHASVPVLGLVPNTESASVLSRERRFSSSYTDSLFDNRTEGGFTAPPPYSQID